MLNPTFDTWKPKFGWILVMIGLISFSCAQDKRPEGVLSPEEMSKIMVELYLAEARLNTRSIMRDSATRLFRPFEERFLREQGLADSTLNNSYQYYFDHADELEKIYDSVIDTLTLREQRAQSQSRPGETLN